MSGDGTSARSPGAGFRIDALSEPLPAPELRERFPEDWERLTTHPHFPFLRLLALNA